MAREMERRAARESPGAEIERLMGVVPEDVGEWAQAIIGEWTARIERERRERVRAEQEAVMAVV
jgi:hypothetical protein